MNRLIYFRLINYAIISVGVCYKYYYLTHLGTVVSIHRILLKCSVVGSNPSAHLSQPYYWSTQP